MTILITLIPYFTGSTFFTSQSTQASSSLPVLPETGNAATPGFKNFHPSLEIVHVREHKPGASHSVSCKTGENMDAWVDWLVKKVNTEKVRNKGNQDGH